jgi:hypothetical protein
MNAPERIRGLVIAPGVVSLGAGVSVNISARLHAASVILRQIERAKPSGTVKNARHYLARARSRHGR